MKYREYVTQSIFDHADGPLGDWRQVERTVDALGEAGVLRRPLDDDGYVEEIRTIGADRPVRTEWVSTPTESEEREG
ncbi:hypothetical protein [Cellulosimicrobium sp. TH-20]|uniref:hypothetical protein n=1 Tax=Cellulosimicrobium sp. TH-20 TaxID=1980001 RepID=UPI0011A52B1E|nr:hypothetical protein [Cellulosimicrobium sp. TH-20]